VLSQKKGKQIKKDRRSQPAGQGGKNQFPPRKRRRYASDRKKKMQTRGKKKKEVDPYPANGKKKTEGYCFSAIKVP